MTDSRRRRMNYAVIAIVSGALWIAILLMGALMWHAIDSFADWMAR